MKTSSVPFSTAQKKLLCLCMIAYSCTYFMRVNLSVALPAIADELVLSSSELGGLSSAFFWTYAIGQLINGWLGDRLPTKFMVLFGLLISALTNVLLPFCSSAGPMVVLWAVNGLFQSMLWAPMMRTLSMHFSGEKLVFASFSMSVTLVIGYIGAWAGSTVLQNLFGWKMIFLAPALLALVFCIVWIFLFPLEKKSAVVSATSTSVLSGNSALFHNTRLLGFLILILGLAVSLGMVKESINVWLPSLITELDIFSAKSSVFIYICIPLINFLGILFSRAMIGRLQGNVYRTVHFVWFIGLCAVSLLMASFWINNILVLLFLVLVFSLMFALTPLFTSFIPLGFRKWDCVSTVTGLVDFAIYIGAALSSVLSGFILGDTKNWKALGGFWTVVLASGFVLNIVVCRIYRTILREELE